MEKEEIKNVDTVNDENVEYYEKVDSEDGYITDEREINKLRNRRFKEEIFNDLLGVFSENGEYVISNDIMIELVNMPKKVTATTLNGTEARGYVGDRVFDFNVTPPTTLENGDAYCYLQFKEQISQVNGYIINTLTTVVATYEYKFDKLFLENAYRAFNIREKTDDAKDTPDQIMPQFLLQRLDILAAMRNQGENPFEKIEEAYYNKRLQILAEIPEATALLAEFTKKKSAVELYFINNAEYRYHTLNTLLDEVMESGIGVKFFKENPRVASLLELEDKYNAATAKTIGSIKENQIVKHAESKSVFTKVVSGGKPMDKAPPKVPNNVKIGGTGKSFKSKSKPKAKAKPQEAKKEGIDYSNPQPTPPPPTNKSQTEKPKQTPDMGNQKPQNTKNARKIGLSRFR